MTLPSRHYKYEFWNLAVVEAEIATSRPRRLPTILNIYEWAGKEHFASLKLECQCGVRTCDLRLAKQAALSTTPGPPPQNRIRDIPANTRYRPNVGPPSTMLAQHWVDISCLLGCLMLSACEQTFITLQLNNWKCTSIEYWSIFCSLVDVGVMLRYRQ